MNCPHCNMNLPDGLTICFNCGGQLSEPVAQPVPAAQSVPAYQPVPAAQPMPAYQLPPPQYTPPHIAQSAPPPPPAAAAKGKGGKRALWLVLPPVAALLIGVAVFQWLSGGLPDGLSGGQPGRASHGGNVPDGALLSVSSRDVPDLMPIEEFYTNTGAGSAANGNTPGSNSGNSIAPANPQGGAQDGLNDGMHNDPQQGDGSGHTLDETPDSPDAVDEAATTPSPAGGPNRDITLNRELLGMIGITNEELIAINGMDCATIMQDGGPSVSYYEKPVPYPLHFHLEGDWDEIWAAWESVSSTFTIRNIWPGNARVGAIRLYPENAKYLFGADGPISYEELAKAFDITSELFFIAQEDQHEQWDHDIYTCEFYYDGYGIFATFRQDGNDALILVKAIVYRNTP